MFCTTPNTTHSSCYDSSSHHLQAISLLQFKIVCCIFLRIISELYAVIGINKQVFVILGNDSILSKSQRAESFC